MRRRYTLRENLISAAIGVGIGLPISLAAAREWSKTPEILLKTQAVYADQKRQATAENTNKPKEAQHENHT